MPSAYPSSWAPPKMPRPLARRCSPPLAAAPSRRSPRPPHLSHSQMWTRSSQIQPRRRSTPNGPRCCARLCGNCAQHGARSPRTRRRRTRGTERLSARGQSGGKDVLACYNKPTRRFPPKAAGRLIYEGERLHMSDRPPASTSSPDADTWESLSEPIAWRPSEEYLSRSRLLRFMRRHGIADYAALLQRANDDPEWFWGAVPDDLGLVWQRPYIAVMDTSRGVPWTRWYVGGQLNYVATALDKHAAATPDKYAVVWEGEDGAVRRFTYAELLAMTNRAANALRELGVKRGDRVAIYMPMIPETVAATLACGKLGAIFMPVFSGYGAEAVATRLQDSGASVVITADGFTRRGKPVAMKVVADSAVTGAPSVGHVLVVRRLGGETPWLAGGDVCG